MKAYGVAFLRILWELCVLLGKVSSVVGVVTMRTPRLVSPVGQRWFT